jgi:hypothetical protein
MGIVLTSDFNIRAFFGLGDPEDFAVFVSRPYWKTQVSISLYPVEMSASSYISFLTF